MTAPHEVKSFQGTSYAECRGKWSQWCDEQQSEPELVGVEAHRVGGLYEIVFRYTFEEPE